MPVLRGVRAITEIALHTASAFLAIGAALLLADPEQGAAQTVFSATSGGSLARRTVPLLLLLPAGMGWLRLEWQRGGGLGLESGLAIYTLANTLVLGGVLAWLARRLAWGDVERARAYTDLQRERDRLELRVGERTAELVQANEELHARSRTLADFKAALDQHANVTITDSHGMIVYVNDAYVEVSGYTREELLGKTHRLLRSGHHPVEFIRDFWATISAGRVWKGEFRNRAKDGRLHWMDTTVVPFLGPDGKPAQYVSIQTEITDRKQVEERNAQLAQDLQQRAAQLEAANHELEAFTYSVSHDLRAPLRHIHGYAEMLGATAGAQLPERARHCLDTIVAAVTEMGQLIDDLLDFSRVRQTNLAETTIALDDLVREVIRGLHGATQGRNIAWEIGSLPHVAGDPALLKQALANLLGNAVKYTRKCTEARIEVACVGEDAGRMVFRVCDNGTGFDMKYVHKLFGVFQRLHRAEEFEGTGIGLAIVHRVIERHGGRVWAESTLGAGASFYFTLKPAAKA